MGLDASEDVDAYILNSKYRRSVLTHLAENSPSTPTDIAEETDVRRPHVSRALSELRERDVVELLVSEQTSIGRYYGLTGTGTNAWKRVRERIRTVDWRRTDPQTDEIRRVVEIAEDVCGDALRTVSSYDGDYVDIVRNEGVLAEYTEEEVTDAIRTLVFEHSLADVSLADDELESEVDVFDRCTVLRVRVEEDLTVAVSCERTHEITMPSLADRIVAVFD